jgi:hypothetical protein
MDIVENARRAFEVFLWYSIACPQGLVRIICCLAGAGVFLPRRVMIAYIRNNTRSGGGTTRHRTFRDEWQSMAKTERAVTAKCSATRRRLLGMQGESVSRFVEPADC